jgi:hypothetical protein
VTTISERSSAGLAVGHLAMTLVVCGGLVLLLPAPAIANGAPTIAAVIAPGCAASADGAEDQQFTADGAGLDAPDSCEDDDDDDAPGGSDGAIAVDEIRTRVGNNARHGVHVKMDVWLSRAVEGHSLRGPPQNDQTSPDADIDGDDDDPSPESSTIRPATSSCDARLLRAADFLNASSFRFDNLAPRAPPL